MSAKHALFFATLAVALMLSGCVRAVYDESGSEPQQTATPSPPSTATVEASPTPTAGPPSAALLYLETAVVALTVGEATTVNVWVEDAQRLNAIHLEMSFNPTYLQVEDADSATEGTQIAAGSIPEPAEIIANEVTVAEEGRISYHAAQEPGTSSDGSGVIASITLRGLAVGGTPLEFISVAAYDPEGNPLDIVPISHGIITVTDAEVTPAPTAAATEEATVQPTTEPSPQPTSVPTTPVTAEPTAVSTPSPVPSPVSTGGIYYVVQSGQNLFRIGLMFGTTADAIASASGITDPDQVQAGTMLLVPVPPPRSTFGYYVQPRDTVYSIARRFGMTLDELVTLNAIGADHHIEVGQILAVTP